MNILLIDDDKDFLFLLSKSITREGHHVYTAQNGLSALDALHDHKIDVVISDVVMRDTPIMSLTCTLKNLYPETPIILVSGLPGGHLIDYSLKLGADEFLPKPLNVKELIRTASRLRPS